MACRSHCRSLVWVLLILSWCAAWWCALGRAAAAPRAGLPTLTTARQVRRLTRSEGNRGYPVILRGVITFKDQYGFFIQDSTEAISVDSATLAPRAHPGEFIELTGTTAAQGFAPVIEGRHLRVLGSAAMPRPHSPTFEQMASTELDSQWVEVGGIVHAAVVDEANPALDIAVSGG